MMLIPEDRRQAGDKAMVEWMGDNESVFEKLLHDVAVEYSTASVKALLKVPTFLSIR